MQFTRREKATQASLIILGHTVKHIFASSFWILLPEIKLNLGLNHSQVGMIATAKNIIGGVANFPAGFAADRFTERRTEILTLSIFGCGIFSFALGISTNFWFALINSTCMAIAITFWHPAAISALSQQFENRRGFAISLHGTGGSVGEAVGPVLVGILIETIGWKLTLQSGLIPAILIGSVIWLFLRNFRDSNYSDSSLWTYLISLRSLIRTNGLLLILLIAGGYGASQSVTLTFLPVYLREDIGVSSFVVGIYLSLAQVAGIASQPAMGYLSDRFGRKKVLVPAFSLFAISIFLLHVSPPGWPLLLTVFAMGFVVFSPMAIILATAIDFVGEEFQATAVSLVFGSTIIVAGITPSLAGFTSDLFGIKSSFLWAGGIMVATAVASLGIRK